MEGETMRERGCGWLAVWRASAVGCLVAALLQAAPRLAATPAADEAVEFRVLSLAGGGDGSISLEWSPLSGALGYQVEARGDLVAGSWALYPPVEQWPIRALTWRAAPPDPGLRFFRVVAFVDPQFARGRLLSSVLFDQLTPAEITALFTQNSIPVPVTFGVDVYVLAYETVDPHQFRTTASGTLMVPQGPAGPFSVVSYQHGTIVEKDGTPSAGQGLEYLLGLALGTDAYVAAMPDYLGLGDSPGLHPYLHAASEAAAVIDFLRATREFCQNQGVVLGEKLFLVGYSQGGHATMAAHRRIQEEHAGEFTVTAAAPMAGPYDMSGTMASQLLSDQPYGDPYYLPYVLFAYDAVYDLFDDPAEYLIEPYATILPPLFDGAHSSSEINAVMPAVPKQIFHPSLLDAFAADPEHPLRQALRDNDLYDWVPAAPVRLYHCAGDRTVPPANSDVAYAAMLANGAPDVQRLDPFRFADHGTCAPFALLAAKAWIDTLAW